MTYTDEQTQCVMDIELMTSLHEGKGESWVVCRECAGYAELAVDIYI